MRFVFAFIMLAGTCLGHDLPREDSSALTQWTPSRPDVSLGFGPIIDDLESYAKPGHPMRNVSDPGNWVHELTHQVNSEMRGVVTRMKGRPFNTAYVLNGYAVSLPEPKVKLSQVAALVPKDKRTSTYQLYLVDQQRWWQTRPLYVLDEATAAANALYYQCSVEKVDKHRQTLCERWMYFSTVMVYAVEQYDPKYEKMEKLRAFVIWHNRRMRHLIQDHIRLTEPYNLGEEK